MSDAYSGYNAVEGVTHCYCWAHTRRYWRDALPKKKEGSKAQIGLEYCDRLFALERKWADLPAKERYEQRKKHTEPLLDQYFAWVDSVEALVASHLGKAVTYSRNNRDGLRGYLQDGRVELFNNRIEGNIRKFVIGRKNWIAVETVVGAKASAICYSMVLTAIENNLNVYEYLRHLFHTLPERRKSKDQALLEQCLPWSKELPPQFYMKQEKKSEPTGQMELSL